jgi:hypothetical protein
VIIQRLVEETEAHILLKKKLIYIFSLRTTKLTYIIGLLLLFFLGLFSGFLSGGTTSSGTRSDSSTTSGDRGELRNTLSNGLQ